MANHGGWGYTIRRLFFCLIAAYQANRIPQLKRDVRPLLYCSLFLSMAALSHLEWGITTFVTISLLVLSRQPSKRGVGLVIALAAIALIVTSPWWLTVLIRHGFDPFLAASKTGEWDSSRLEGPLSLLGIFNDNLGNVPLGVLALIGWLLSLARRDWVIPVWLIAIHVTTPRHGATAATMPIAILAAVGLAQFVRPILTRGVVFTKNRINAARGFGSRLARDYPLSQRPLPRSGVVLGVIAVLSILIATKFIYTNSSRLIGLSPDERSAMAWIKENTPSEAKFIVLANSLSWQDDRIAEWFPVLADRHSLTTVQGLEWVTGDDFRTRIVSVKELKHHQAVAINELVGYVESHYDSFQYVAVFIPYTNPNYGGFIESRQYRVAYNNGAALVLKKAERSSSLL